MKNVGRWLGIGVCILFLVAALTPSPESKLNLGLTAEQRQEDFLYLHTTLERLYPYWGEMEDLGVNTNALAQEMEQKIAGTNSDAQFVKILHNYIRQLQNQDWIGHLTLLGGDYYSYMELYIQSGVYVPWAEQLTKPETVETYALLYPKAAEAAAHPEERQSDERMCIEARMMRENTVAYLRIPTFENSVMMEEGPKAAAFIQSAGEAGCEDLILDIRGNGGGNSNYWYQYIVRPNLTEDTTTTSYFLVKEESIQDEWLRPFLETRYDMPAVLHPIQEFPSYDGLSPAARNFPYYIESVTQYPSANPEHPFTGRIWLLCDQSNVSASEGLVEFCQQTDFATVVGVQTGGDRCAVDPVLFTLPNSGLVVRFDSLYAVNGDGSCNAIAGAKPDVDTGERDALNACLERIEAEKS